MTYALSGQVGMIRGINMDKIRLAMFGMIILLSGLLIAVTQHHDVVVSKYNNCSEELNNCTNNCIAVKQPSKRTYIPPKDINWSAVLKIAE